MKIAHVIIDSGFGDAGKGLMTDFFSDLYRSHKPIVIRYNGGSQAGHTVCTPSGERHVFQHFGSGCLNNVPTYLAKEFIVNPIMFNKEYDTLNEMNHRPFIFINRECRITTPYDILLNHIIEESRDTRHGSCGLGIFETITRHNVIPFTVASISGKNNEHVRETLLSIKEYVYQRLNELDITITNAIKERIELNVIDPFIGDLHSFCYRSMTVDDSHLKNHSTLIFESAQGLLLSEKHGQMPHLTPSDPGLTIPIEICNKLNVSSMNVCYVTRCYTTRHGNGPLTNELSLDGLGLKNTEAETNVINDFQGKFRYAKLDIPQIKAAIESDYRLTRDFKGISSQQLAITCIDQLPNYDIDPSFKYGLTLDNLSYMQYIRNMIGISDGYYSVGPTRAHIHKSTDW